MEHLNSAAYFDLKRNPFSQNVDYKILECPNQRCTIRRHKASENAQTKTYNRKKRSKFCVFESRGIIQWIEKKCIQIYFVCLRMSKHLLKGIMTTRTLALTLPLPLPLNMKSQTNIFIWAHRASVVNLCWFIQNWIDDVDVPEHLVGKSEVKVVRVAIATAAVDGICTPTVAHYKSWWKWWITMEAIV